MGEFQVYDFEYITKEHPVVKVYLRCVGCKQLKQVLEMPRTLPFCDDCGMPMVLEKVQAKLLKKRG